LVAFPTCLGPPSSVAFPTRLGPPFAIAVAPCFGLFARSLFVGLSWFFLFGGRVLVSVIGRGRQAEQNAKPKNGDGHDQGFLQ
jgi:hypothetical protein